MGSRFYLPAAVESTPISPDPSTAWTDTTILQRAMCKTVKRSLLMTSVDFSDTDSTLKKIIFRQYISDALQVGQLLESTSPEFWHVEVACRALEGGVSNNMFFNVGCRIIGSANEIRAVILSPIALSPELDVNFKCRTAVIQCDEFSYTTQAGDRIVIEIGTSGDPVG